MCWRLFVAAAKVHTRVCRSASHTWTHFFSRSKINKNTEKREKENPLQKAKTNVQKNEKKRKQKQLQAKTRWKRYAMHIFKYLSSAWSVNIGNERKAGDFCA